MNTGLILVGMLGSGVIAAVGEKVLNGFGKPEMATFLNITGLCGIGLGGIKIVIDLIQMLLKLV